MVAPFAEDKSTKPHNGSFCRPKSGFRLVDVSFTGIWWPLRRIGFRTSRCHPFRCLSANPPEHALLLSSGVAQLVNVFEETCLPKPKEPTLYGCMTEQHRIKCHDGIDVPLACTGAQQELIKENHLN
ncbi:hypothetical protein Y032_0006g2923 [Ancylostoma ceylanicum]|uniref:Uncharacterized protein n=1 Tax=Ancylostoma ceylanicum TaxID=53326 RepID=A0A016VRC8_9BILA|nr:hypothetical protein Y032_0006g2923 [Ancylostoma ceylanicum]